MARPNAVESYEAATRLVRGVRLGRYELLLPIAAGGMGQVWAARFVGSHGFSKLVAIKTILPLLVADAEVEKMFLDEARVAAMVHHPNVCQTLELGDESKTLYMVMEWVDGASFRELVRTESRGINPVPPPIAARIVADVCAGLHAAHDLVDDDGNHLEVVHRDVSPQNVLLSGDGAVKVTDFGLVRALGRLHVTRASRPKGKVGYMAPEQLSGGTIDRRADIFSAGCVLYEATTGQPPFPGDGEPQVIARMLIGEYELPSTLEPDFPQEL
jgi:eukaryotic-like serine/threonine-protein kinase